MNNKLRALKKRLSKIRRDEAGLALPLVLATLTLGSLLILPSLTHALTSLNTVQMVEKKMDGLYAADAGVEDALWILSNDEPASFPYCYQLNDVNGMTVDVVIDEITTIVGEEAGSGGIHEDWLETTKSVSYSAGIYYYTLYLTNNGCGNISIEQILIYFPPDLDYVDDSIGGDITTNEPTIIGDPTTGITPVWDISSPYPTIPPTETKEHTFQLSGPPDVGGVEGHGFVKASRDDVGTIWDVDSQPYSIVAQAKDADDTVAATIRAGVWGVSQLSISCWELNP